MAMEASHGVGADKKRRSGALLVIDEMRPQSVPIFNLSMKEASWGRFAQPHSCLVSGLHPILCLRARATHISRHVPGRSWVRFQKSGKVAGFVTNTCRIFTVTILGLLLS